MSNIRRPSKPPPSDRRRGADRRKEDKGPPPGVRERRLTLEPRQPEVTEGEISPSDWDRLQDLPPVPPGKR